MYVSKEDTHTYISSYFKIMYILKHIGYIVSLTYWQSGAFSLMEYVGEILDKT